MDAPKKSVLQLTKMHESFISFGKLLGDSTRVFAVEEAWLAVWAGWCRVVGLLEIEEEIDEA